MGEWTKGTLSEISEIVMGQSPSGDTCNGAGEGTPLLNGPTEFGFRFPEPVQFTVDPKKLCESDDILFCVRGSTTGRMNWADQEYALGRGLAAIRHKQGNEFRYFVRGVIDFNLPLLLASVTGSTFPSVSRDQLASLDVLIPPPNEQKAIASVLSSIDDKMDLLYRQNKTLEAIAEALFRQWFVEEAQEDWEEKRLADYADHMKVSVKPANNPARLYTHYSLPAFDEGIRPVVEIGSEILSNKYEVPPWTILVSKLNPRFPRIWPIGGNPGENSICSTEFQVFKARNKKLYGYLYFLLKSKDAREELSMAASGTSGSHQRVRPEDILNIAVRIPSVTLAESYSELVMPSIKKLMANLQQIQSLEKLRDTLLPKLMSGEVRVEYEY